MPPKATSASKAPQTEAEDSASDRDDTHEERITALETIVQSMNSKLDQILASLAVQRLPSPPEAFKPLPKPSSTAEATTRDIGLFDPSDDAEAVRSEKQDTVYGDVTLFANKLRRVAARKIVQLEDLKPLSLIEIRPRLAQRQILISNFAQQVFGRYLPPPRRIEGPVAEFQQEAKMPAEKRDWKRKKDDRRTYFMKTVTDEADREDEFNITV